MPEPGVPAKWPAGVGRRLSEGLGGTGGVQLLRGAKPGEHGDAQQPQPTWVTCLGTVEDKSGTPKHGNGHDMEERGVQPSARWLRA